MRSECKLSNGRSRSYKVLNCFFLQRDEWSRSYREMNEHPSLPWNFVRRESCGGMEWLGVWNYIFRALNFKILSLEFDKVAVSADFQGFSWKFRPLKNILRTLENGHSTRHQSIPPLSAGRFITHGFPDPSMFPEY